MSTAGTATEPDERKAEQPVTAAVAEAQQAGQAPATDQARSTTEGTPTEQPRTATDNTPTERAPATGETRVAEDPGEPGNTEDAPAGSAQLRLVAVTAEPDRRRFDSIGEQLLAEPARTPEILAYALVQALGPRAQGWADHVRARYPTASREALARLAVQRFARTAALRGGVGALAGPYAPVALGAATVITHADLVLHLAAVYGLEAADPQRATDLLRLASPGVGPVVGWAALSLAGPGVRLLAAVLSARTTTEAVAVRARRYFAEYPAGT
ncbi:hypothetical protein [Actinoplanes xinjiangensis]|uniref:hypothetical protein n=1 Tax=Actinoplanes xinjiangensis TaxID=512350 RepID=UPI003447661B